MKEQRLEELIRIADLIKKNWFDELSEEEKTELLAWQNRTEANRQLADRLNNEGLITDDLLKLEEYDTEKAIQEIFSRTYLSSETKNTESDATAIPTIKWYKWAAAAAVIIAVIGTYFFIHSERVDTPPALARTQPMVIEPGSNKAILTLDDGSKLVLDSTENGKIITQGAIDVVKLEDGRLAYQATTKETGSKPLYNTISTPRGGQYQVRLPDGTEVWLNSASSIRFPIHLDRTERLVEITGEAYLEVNTVLAKDKKNKTPFIVELTDQRITVLGTKFNVNAYADEEAVKTTLIEGSVLLTSGKTNKLIKPGEQALLTAETKNYKINYPNLDEVLAWKNGRFLFRNANAQSILRQFSRWYDIEVRYKDDVSDILFSGGISRKDRLDQLIELLELDGRMKLNMKGREMIVTRTDK